MTSNHEGDISQNTDGRPSKWEAVVITKNVVLVNNTSHPSRLTHPISYRFPQAHQVLEPIKECRGLWLCQMQPCQSNCRAIGVAKTEPSRTKLAKTELDQNGNNEDNPVKFVALDMKLVNQHSFQSIMKYA
jgi:hypothetical protein